MRIISGTAGKRTLQVPKAVTRPSTDRLREALFSILSHRMEGARVLDLFAGSGALGLECLSRGAKSCDFVDDSREAGRVIRRNLKSLGLQGGSMNERDVFGFLRGGVGPYDLVFADPPYYQSRGDRDFIAELLQHETLPQMVAEDALLVLEDPPANRRDGLEEGTCWSLLDRRKYGSCGILFYQRVLNP
ncbi:16S rRNA (guanine(966)-N(2))-methyltransferase RsmD [Verrucomicrobiaceae bacterium N1E253]|uniref:16S rRNA (Guanine(966)-N(2))-methyltransferase RsmD n=1 Tax=Oceaniferula marina TaxID=2748318 RepID=A0A851GP54_9BACT|nr:16S rRNA (guanine(966)-N(2))-methyltransferase RsmD [Oceaniferula marina]NWK56905.1 16S rRNA (guanine(966)-N(2))-methyltransferase RsmD [Oceaniferula marina]